MSDPLDLSKLREALAKADFEATLNIRQYRDTHWMIFDGEECLADGLSRTDAELFVYAVLAAPSLLDAAEWAQLHEKAYHARGDLIHKQEAEIATLRADVGRLRGAISGATITTTKKKKS